MQFVCKIHLISRQGGAVLLSDFSLNVWDQYVRADIYDKEVYKPERASIDRRTLSSDVDASQACSAPSGFLPN